MIHLALQALVAELNAYLKRVFGLADSQSIALLTALTSPDGSVNADVLNKLCFTLVGLEQETTLRNGAAGRRQEGSQGPEHLRANPAVRLNLRLVLSANFSDYAEALKFLSAAIAFFQRTNVLTPQNTPTLDAQLDKVIIELETVETQEWSYLWGMLGTKCLPAVVYKVRMLTLQEVPDGQARPAISATGQQTSA